MLPMHSNMEKVMKLTHPCRCPKCENSCKFGSGAMVKEDMKNLAEFLQITEKKLKKKYLEKTTKFNTTRYRPKLEREDDKPYGKCVFYDDVKGCTVHIVKPMECKIAMGCKEYGEELITWFNLQHYLNSKDPESLRQYKIYLESGGKTLPGAELSDEIKEKLDNYDDLKNDKDWDAVLGIKEDDKK